MSEISRDAQGSGVLSLLSPCLRLSVYVCAYLSDGLWDAVAATGVCEAYSCVQADLVANRHIHRFRALVGAPQRLVTDKRLHYRTASPNLTRFVKFDFYKGALL